MSKDSENDLVFQSLDTLIAKKDPPNHGKGSPLDFLAQASLTFGDSAYMTKWVQTASNGKERITIVPGPSSSSLKLHKGNGKLPPMDLTKPFARKCRNRECSNLCGQAGKPRSIYCSKRCQSREQNLRQGRIKNVRSPPQLQQSVSSISNTSNQSNNSSSSNSSNSIISSSSSAFSSTKSNGHSGFSSGSNDDSNSPKSTPSPSPLQNLNASSSSPVPPSSTSPAPSPNPFSHLASPSQSPIPSNLMMPPSGLFGSGGSNLFHTLAPSPSTFSSSPLSINLGLVPTPRLGVLSPLNIGAPSPLFSSSLVPSLPTPTPTPPPLPSSYMLSNSPSPPVGIYLPNPIKPMPTHVTAPPGGPLKQPVSPVQPTSGTFTPPEKKSSSQQDSIDLPNTPISNSDSKNDFNEGFTLAPLKS